MIFNQNRLILFLLLLGCVGLAGCGSNLLGGSHPDGNRSDTDFPGGKANAVIEFDQKLASIKDARSAESAVQYFADHVIQNSVVSDQSTSQEPGTRISSFASVQSIFRPSMTQQFAKIEARARENLKNGTISSAAVDEGMVSPEKLATIINSYCPKNSDSDLVIDAGDIISDRDLIRQNIPHLAASDSRNMTPLEASVITYFLLTGDKGEGQPKGYELRTTPEEMSDFSQKLVKE